MLLFGRLHQSLDATVIPMVFKRLTPMAADQSLRPEIGSALSSIFLQKNIGHLIDAASLTTKSLEEDVLLKLNPLKQGPFTNMIKIQDAKQPF